MHPTWQRSACTPAAPEPKDLEAVAQGLRRGGGGCLAAVGQAVLARFHPDGNRLLAEPSVAVSESRCEVGHPPFHRSTPMDEVSHQGGLESVVGRQGAREPGFVAIAEKVQNTDHMATTTVRARRAMAWYRCS